MAVWNKQRLKKKKKTERHSEILYQMNQGSNQLFSTLRPKFLYWEVAFIKKSKNVPQSTSHGVDFFTSGGK